MSFTKYHIVGSLKYVVNYRNYYDQFRVDLC